MLPIQITIRDISNSPTLKTHIEEKFAKLERFYNRIMSCHVVVEVSQKHKHQGKIYNVRIDLKVPRRELVVTKKTDQDMYVAIRDAFDAIARQLEEFARKRQGRVKTHEEIMHGCITRLVENEGYGFIEGADGNEYYFNDLNMHYPAFNKLTIGDLVAYIPQAMKSGRQAHRVVKENVSAVKE